MELLLSMKKLICIKWIICFCVGMVWGSAFCDEDVPNCMPKIIDLKTAINRALKAAPGIQSAELGLWIRAADTLQAGLIPNPLFNLAVGQVGLYNEFEDDDSNELAYSIAQLFELGGKRGARIGAAEAEEFAARLDLEIAVRDVYTKVVKRFIDVVAAQESLVLAVQQLNLAKNVLHTVEAKVEAGKLSLVQQHKSNSALVTAQLEVNKANRALASAKKNLALTWGQCNADFDSVCYPLYDIIAPKTLPDLCLALGCNLEILKGEYLAWAAFQRIELEKSRAVPDVILSAGIDHKHHFKSAAFGFSLTVPIPIFDRNQGYIAKAEFELSQIQVIQEIAKVDLQEDLIELYELLMNAYEQVIVYRDSIIELSTKTFNDIHTGFDEGKFEYLDVLDAQRTLFENQTAYISYLNQYYTSRAEIERILGVNSCSQGNILSDN